MEKKTGIIKLKKVEKGYGFITKEDGEDIFFHCSGLLEPKNIAELRIGMQVEYIISKNKYDRDMAIGIIEVI